MEPFTFDKLPWPSWHQIRIFELEPGTDQQPICGSLHVAKIGEQVHVAYDALSYVWGDEEPSEAIFISGKVLLVKPNLHNFLLHLRHKNRVLYVWADAICINQADRDERSSQVQYMGDIYRESSSTRIWLGSHSRTTALLMKYVTSVIDEKWAVSASHCSERLSAQDMVPENERIALIDGLKSIVSNVYWTRLWIVQEVLIPKHLIVHIGDTKISWSLFVEQLSFFFSLMPESGPKSLSLHAHAQSTFLRMILQLDRHRQTYKKAYSRRDLSFADLLAAYGQNQCMDIRDRVYGLLGLAPDPWLVIVDYARSVAELFCETINKLGGECRWRMAEVLWSSLQVGRYPFSNNMVLFDVVDIQTYKPCTWSGNSWTSGTIKQHFHYPDDAQMRVCNLRAQSERKSALCRDIVRAARDNTIRPKLVHVAFGDACTKVVYLALEEPSSSPWRITVEIIYAGEPVHQATLPCAVVGAVIFPKLPEDVRTLGPDKYSWEGDVRFDAAKSKLGLSTVVFPSDGRVWLELCLPELEKVLFAVRDFPIRHKVV